MKTKKKFWKRCLALLLLLVLSIAGMSPCIAAENVGRGTCGHVWARLNSSVQYVADSNNAVQHHRIDTTLYHCINCSVTKNEEIRVWEPHAWVGNTCKKCGGVFKA